MKILGALNQQLDMLQETEFRGYDLNSVPENHRQMLRIFGNPLNYPFIVVFY